MANYVLIVSGQSNAVGRASNPIADATIAAYTFTRTKIWVSGAWATLNPADHTQSYDQVINNHGVEPHIGYWFEQNYPGDTLYIIKYAVGGMGLDPASSTPNFDPATGALYASLRDTYLIPAFASAPLVSGYTPLGFWWMQGETDSMASAWADAYYTNLTNFFDSLAADVPETANFKRIIGAVRENAAWTYRDALRAGQAAYCAIPANNATLLQTDAVADNGGGDTVHYSAAGFVTLGRSLWRLLNWSAATASTHQQHKHRRVAAATAGVSTDRLLYGKLLDDLVVGEILADVRAEGPGLYFIDEDGNVARMPAADRMPAGSVYQPTLAFIGDKRTGFYSPGAGKLGLARYGAVIFGIGAYSGGPAFGIGTESPVRTLHIHNTTNNDSTLQLTNGLTGAGSSDGVNLSMLDATMVQLWNHENGRIRIGTNNTERISFPADSAGIAFPAVQQASSNANTLDDYEEGTFTATLTGVTTAPTTPVTATGSYTKIGNLVSVQVEFANVNTTGASGQMQVTGLPFNSAGTPRGTTSAALTGGMAIASKDLAGLVNSGTNTIDFWNNVDSGGFTAANISAGAGKYLFFQATYNV